ncbi:hypothetical protein HOLleu_44951 [Holothuria leucospilota]|uniref:CCHC-type domain-containing protein n=1 Tax=Holothuria leucospilota TaxID=206669 RepID=A0A9Q1BA64_HOLLE|nr:hypothetical protein HOLleu_44951 [Holothuria leucospilota]
MDRLSPPPKLQMEGNLSENWKRCKQQFLLYLTAAGYEGKEAKIKTSLLLHVIGEEALDIYNTFTFTNDAEGNPTNMNLDIVMDKFQNYCTPKKNITYERHKFFTCIQKPGESIDHYLTELRTKSKSCDFGDLADSLIRDRIICGIPNNALRERLLREEDLTLSKAVQMCRAAETTRSQVKELQSDDVVLVHAVHAAQQQKHSRTEQSKGQSEVTSQQQNKPKYNCGRCGRKHGPGECPATGKKCAKCGKIGHFAKCCRTRNLPKKVDMVQETSHTLPTEEFFVDTITSKDVDSTWLLPLAVNGSIIPFKLDTGADVNLMPEKDYQTLRPKPRLHKVQATVKSYGGAKIPILGKC